MNTFRRIALLAVAVFAVSTSAFAGVVISQVYGGGGNAGSVYKNDFIELFNNGASPVSVAGWSVQYAAATGTTWQVTNLTGSIAAGQYYLVQEAVGAGGTTNLPTPDATGAIPMSGTAGKVALVNVTTALTGACPAGASIVDFVGFGATANCFEGAGPTPAPSNSNSVFRAANGCTDTNVNSADFSAALAAPRNTASPTNSCVANTAPAITPPANPITTVAQNAAPFTVNVSGTDDNNIFNWSATPGTGVQSVSVTGGQGTSTVTYTVTLTAGYSGTATFTATLTDNVNTPVNQAVNITVVAPPAQVTGLTAAAGTSHVQLNWTAVGGATSYNVKRSTSSGTEATIASPATNSYDDTTAVDGTPYFYVVSAVGAGGEGANSSEVTATPIAAPTGLVATPGNNHVQLSWTAVTGATGYDVQRSTTSGSGYASIATPGTNSHDDLTAFNGVTYYYIVKATNANGLSLASSEVSATPNPPGKIVISQVYGGGGNAGSVFKNDFIELFNSGGTAVSVAGWSVQYAAATGTTWQVTNLSGSIGPGQYYLVQEAVGAGGTTNLPTPDATGAIPMAAAAGKVALVNVTTAQTGACPAGAQIIDFVGFGATANCFEGAGPTPAPSNTNSVFRAAGGCQDTNVNSADFTAAAAAPRNTASALHNPRKTPPTPSSPPANPITTVAQDAAPFTVGLTGSDDNNVFNWSAAPGAGVQSVNVTGGQGTANVTYTVTLVAGFNGDAQFTATLTDNVNPPVNQLVHITVTATPPPAAPTGLIATAGDSHVQLNWNTVSGATSYNVKRSTTSGAETTIASPGTNSYDDTTAVNGTTYFYVVSAVGPGGEGANSSEVSATPTAVTPVPTGLLAVVSNGNVALSWNVVGSATSYNLKRSLTPGGPYSTINSPAGTSYNDSAVTNGTRYYYVVSAVAPVTGESANSAERHAKPDFPEALGIDISQVYGAGGNTGAVYTNDFIELFNRGNSVVDLNGWSVQYSSAAGTTWTPTALSGTIAPGQHYLVGEGAGAGGTTPLPATDASGGIAMSGTAGKVALSSSSSALTGGCPTGLVDFVGYGSTASCFEGSGPTPNPSSNANSLNRPSNGCVDTNNNAADFTNAAANPRNTPAAATPCTITAIGYASPSAVASGSTVTLRVELPPATTGGSVTADLTSIGGGPAQTLFDNATNGDVTAGDNIFTISGTATGSSGVKSLPVSASNSLAQTANTSILLTITPPLETIAAVKVDTTPADTVPDRLGQAVLVRGVVTSVDFRGGAGIEYYIQDTTGGIDVFNTSDLGPALALGTNVEVSGTLTQFNGLTEMTPTSITILPSGTLPPVTPQVVTLSQLADGAGESLEGKLVRINDVTLSAPPATWGANTNYVATDVSGSGTIRIDGDTDIDGTTAPAGVFSIIGLVGQSDVSNPFDCCYQLLPRSTADIIPRTSPTGTGAANPPSVPPGGTTLLTVTVTMGQNPPSTGISVVADLSLIGLSASQAFLDDGLNGDVAPGDQIYSYNATVNGATPLGPKSLPFQISDAEARSGSGTIPLNIQSASAPPTPLNLVATPGNGQVGLTWDPSIGASGYNVKRSTVSGGPYTTIAPNIGTNSYTDTTVTNSVHYYYVVSALSGANESGDSAQADAIPSAPPPSGPLAKVYFVDIGQGASTLIVSPTGKSMLIDGGPGGSGTTELTSTLNTALGPSGKIDYLVLTHYHVDHDAGLTDIINANRVSPTAIAYDNGDGANVVPPVPTNSTGTAYTSYKNALSAHSISRQVATPGTTIDLGGGVRATFMAAGGVLSSGGHVWVSGTDLNSTSVSTLIEFNNFDFLISGDLTGGGQTTTAKTPDVETFVAQMTGDVDFVQLDHHGSTTANGRRFLSQLKAEGSLASVGATNTFGHPNRETANKYLNIPVTSGNTYGGETLPTPGNGPVFYQTDPSPATDNRTTVQGYSGADQAHAGLGTILLKTDGTVSFTMESLDDAGVRISPSAHVYALDPTAGGLATDFPPTVIPMVTPVVPTAADTVTVTALVNDNQPITSVTLNYSLNGAAQAPVTMPPTVGSEYATTIPPQPNGTRVDYTITAVANGLTTNYSGGYFSGTTTIATLRSMTALGEPTYLDYAARISGLVTSGTGNFSSTNNDDYIDDGTGALNISRTVEPTSPATQPTSTGNTYNVAGFINQLTGRLRLDVTPPFDGVDKPWATSTGSFNGYSITPTGSGAVTPLAKTIAQINADGEGHEAKLVTIANCHVVSGTIPGSGGVDSFLVINDGTGSIEMKIDGDSDIFGLGTLPATFTVTGIVQQDDFLRPFSTRYDIAPRDRTDLGAAAGGPSLITIAEAREDIDPTTNTSPDDYVPDRLGQSVKIRGVVTSVDFRGASGTEIYIQDPTGGVDIFSTSINTVFNIGDNLEVTGTVSQFNGLTEIAPPSASDIIVLAPGTLPNPVMEVVTVSQLGNSGAGEAFEGKLIRVNNVTLVTPPATFAANTNYDITDGTGTVQIRIDADTDIDGTAPPAGTFSIIGVLGQFDNASPFDSGYQLFPRIRATDFLPAVPAAAAISATGGTPQSANINTAFATAMQATVTDGGSNPIDGIGVTFTAPASGASGTFSNDSNTITVATNASGVATAPLFTANGLPGGYDVVASVNALTANFALTNIDTTPTHFSVSAPANVTNGVAFNVTVTALTAANTTAAGYLGTVHFTSSSAGTLPGDYTFIAGDNGVHTFSVTLTTSGPQSITATDTVTGSITGSANTTVSSLTTHFSVSAPVSVTNGTSFNVTVTALDPSEATVTSYTGTVHFTSSSTGTLPSDYTFTGGDNGAHTFSVTLTTNGTQSITATDTVTASITGTTNTNVLTSATHFSVSAPANTTNGTPFNVTVTALNASEGTATDYNGTVHFTSSSTGTLPSDYTFNGGDAGAHTFSVTLTQSGTQSITATDTVTASITGTTNTNVSCPSIPTPTISGGSQFCTGNTVTLTSSSATGNQWYENGSPIGGATNQTYDAGEIGDYTVVVTINGCSSASSAIHHVSNPTPNAAFITSNATLICAGGTVLLSSNSATGIQWYLDGNPISGANSQNYFATVAGSYTAILNALGCQSAPSNTIVLTASANPAPNATITAPASVPQGSSGNVASVADAGAGATYNWLVSGGSVTSGTGTRSITFSPIGTAGVHLQATVTIPDGCSDTKTANVTVTGNGPVTHFSVSAPANVTNGTPFNVTVTALDASNATVPSYTGTVHFTSSSSGTLPADYTFVGADNGAHTFSVTLTTNGVQSITATDTGNASITGTTNTTVAALAATHYSVTAPASVTNGTPFNVTVTALDASNGTVTGYTGTVHFTSSSTGTLPADYTFVGGDNGTHTFSVTLTQNGAQSVTATDTVTPSITGTANLTVNCPALSVTASNSGPVCAPSTVNLFASSPNAGVTYSWTGPGGFTSNQQNPTGVSVSGTYTVTITFNGCTATSSTNVVITSTPSATITAPAAVCANNSYNASAPAGASTYNWSITNGTITSGAGTNAITFNSGATGTTTLNLTVSNGSCSASSSKAMPINSPPSANVPTKLSICGPGTVEIPVTLFGTAPFSITWSDGVVQSGINTKSTKRSVTIAANKTLWITSITDASCTSGTDSKHVLLEIDSAIVVTTPPTDQYVANGATATFSVVATGGNLHYHWYYGNVGDTSVEVGLPDSPTFTTWPIHGIEKFWLRISNSCGTVDSAQLIATNSQIRRRATSH